MGIFKCNNIKGQFFVKAQGERMRNATLTLDSRNRLPLSKLLKFENVRMFDATVAENGTITLKPMVQIPADQVWLWENKEALASVRRGLKSTKRRKIRGI